MKRNLQSVAQFCADSPFTENQVRWWVFNASDNGLTAADALIRIGRRVYIDVDGFDRWLVAQQETTTAARGAA